MMTGLGTDLIGLGPVVVRNYFLERASSSGSDAVKNLTTGLRASSSKDRCPAGINAIVLAYASWQPADMLQYLGRAGLIAACDGEAWVMVRTLQGHRWGGDLGGQARSMACGPNLGISQASIRRFSNNTLTTTWRAVSRWLNPSALICPRHASRCCVVARLRTLQHRAKQFRRRHAVQACGGPRRFEPSIDAAQPPSIGPHCISGLAAQDPRPGARPCEISSAHCLRSAGRSLVDWLMAQDMATACGQLVAAAATAGRAL